MLCIPTLLKCLTICLDATSLRQLSVIVPALLSITGRITMLGISRWIDSGGSYRSVQRFFATPIQWGKLHWCFIRHHFLAHKVSYILAGDEVVVTKSGKETYGLDRFFSSLYKRPIPGLCFFNFSLINTQDRTAHPLLCEQIVREQVEEPEKAKKKQKKAKKKQTKTQQTKAKRKPGRPKGSKNKNKKQPELSPYLCFIQGHLKKLLVRIVKQVQVKYLTLDGAFGDKYPRRNYCRIYCGIAL